MNIIKTYAVNSTCYIESKKMIPQGIVIHSTGVNDPMLARYTDCPESTEKECAHAFIGYDKEKNLSIAEVLPLDICCRNIGIGMKGSFDCNPPYIQLDVCEDGLRDRHYYNKVFCLAAEYCAYLCKKFNLDVKSIVSHKEAYEMGYGSNYADPDYWMNIFGETMGDFRRRVSNLLNISDKTDVDDVIGNKRILPGWIKLQYLHLIQDLERRYPYGGDRGYSGTSRTTDKDVGT